MPKFTRETEFGSITINYKKYGSSGDAVFLLHGLGEENGAWIFQSSVIAKAGFTVYAPDARGFGKSTRLEFPNDKNRSFEFYDLKKDAEDIKALMDHLDIEKAHFIGHSMGGLIAQVIAAFYPENTLTTIIANSYNYPHPRIIAATHAWELAIESMSLKNAFECLIPWVFGEFMMKSKVFEAIKNEAQRTFVKYNSNWCFANKIRCIVTKGPNLIEYIEKIKCPVLLIGGEEDIITPPRYQEHMKTVIPQAKKVIIPKVGHQSILENPKKFNDIVINFLKEQGK